MTHYASLTLLWVCILNAISRPAYQIGQEGGAELLLSDGLGANYIVWFAFIVGCLQIRLKSPLPARVYYISLPLILYPSATVSWLVTAGVAFSLYRHSVDKMPALLMFAAAIREPMTTIFLKIFAGNILGFDAWLTNGLLSLSGQTSLIQSNMVITETGQPLLILTGCSVFSNLSYMTLLWLALHVFFETAIKRISLVILALTIVITLFSNSLRLSLMTLSLEDYTFYHDGLGSSLFEWGLMGLVCAMVLGGLRYAQQK